MDEELGVKAPVTRLRRRLSTEAEGAKSPLTPSTPTKKRSAKLAKPALELIDENVTESVPKQATSRALTKDVEPAEEKPITPSRRSTRIRSNTSLLLEVTQKIVADSPRAKRALRRNSQIGSDTESATTPSRRARTRKDSTSSVEKLAVTSSNEKVIAQVAEAISEEPEKEISKDNLNISQNSTPTRKSPRLNKKSKNTTTDEQKKYENETTKKNDNANTSKLTEDTSSSLNGRITNEETTSNTHDNTDDKPESKDYEIQNHSRNSAKHTNEIKTTDFNKTVSAIEELHNDNGNRKRTKSWTTITANNVSTENINSQTKFASGDSIMERIDIKSPNKSINKSSSIYNTSIENKENILLKSVQAKNSSDTIKILEKTPIKDIQSIVFMEDSDSNGSSGKLIIDINNDGKGEKNNDGDQCVPVLKQATPKRLTSESFVVEPMDIDETIPENVTINDFSDKSNSIKDESNVPDLKQSSPFSNEKSSDINKSSNKPRRISSMSSSLQQESNNSKRKSSITASEENNDFKNALDRSSLTEKTQRKSSISILYENDNFTEKSNKSKRKSSLSKVDSNNDKRKSSANSQDEDKINESSNKSMRKSVSETETQNLEKSTNENKSTLVLSQFKDVSANETSNVSKSPNVTNNELSKSVNVITKETDKNTPRNYLTSTPLQQKPLQKLAMQINTSIISPNIKSKNTSKANKNKTPVKKVSNVSHDSDSSEESDEDSREKSKLIDDEAEEAMDGYESGDSRGAEEKQYEEDHEIIEKCETLESETNLSDDSDESEDYEKDSFIVSSDEEDDALLSGSGDDLSLTDNELKMTTKSKNKFDERKRKEQKNASREMYEARHQLNESNKSSKTKSKKSKGKKLESSASESEEDQPKKKNRLRIDSSQDVSTNKSDADISVCVKKKKTKRLSESVSMDNPNEKEISIQNQSTVEKCDPLAVAIKQEPKTPLKDFNMSTVQINDNIEQVQVDTNTSVIEPNETSDPLQATLAHVDGESDSDISENMEIKENYDSVLRNLNKAKPNKVKTGDTSLNLNKKAKDKIKDPIVDQLNLTQTKKSKKVKAQAAKDNAMAKSANKNKIENDKQDDSECSDSIDMRLLFPEDSNDSEVNASKFNSDKNEEPVDELIHLKRTEAKTNLHESEPEETHLSFFIDTKGAYEDMDISAQNSAKKNKKKHKQSISLDNVEDNLAAPEETSLNDSLKKKKKKNKSFDVSQTDEEPIVNLLEVSSRYEQSILASEETANNSLNSEKKKKKNKSLDNSQFEEYTVSEETPIDVSLNSEKKKKKKNKTQLDVSQIVIEDTAPVETPVNISLNSEKKKKKNKSHLEVSQIVEDAAPEETPIDVSISSDKKKKKNKSHDISLPVENIATVELVVNVSLNSDKKKKNKSPNTHNIEENAATNEDVSQKREKKKKKIKSFDVFQAVDNAGEESDEAPLEVTYKSEKKTDNPEPIEDDDNLAKSKNKFKKKKKKNKNNQPQAGTNTDQGDVKANKRKRDQSSPTADVADDVQTSKSQKKKKLLQNDEGGNSNQGGSTNKSNKRKATDTSDVQINPKVFKGNFFEKIHVARLPETIVNQLDDVAPLVDHPPFKRSKRNQGMVMSTEPFIVEDGPRRKNKPSNYLEQSICLNDSNSPVKLKKKNMNPKVLPFTPTVVTSGKGFTSKFKINVLPEEIQFVAQSSDTANFRNEYLSKQRAKKLRVESFKKHRNHKLAKF